MRRSTFYLWALKCDGAGGITEYSRAVTGCVVQSTQETNGNSTHASIELNISLEYVSHDFQLLL